MMLYHGTSERAARLALKHGLLSRADHGGESTWEIPSSPDAVYLTVAYAGYFAMHAAEPGERWAVVEVDAELLPHWEDGLVPDEDFLEQSTRRQRLPEEWGINGAPMERRTEWFRDRLWMFAHLWEESIYGMGNCAHLGPVPPDAITGVSFIDPSRCRYMCMVAMDPMISLLNYAACGPKYRAVTRWFLGDEVRPEEIEPILAMHPQAFGSRLEQVRQLLSQRDGVEVIRASQA